MDTGTRLGTYEIIEKLGAGGMGEVYRAHDSRLARDVAVKILPPSFATDPESMARFEREARMLAQLNHPNIAGIHGFEESDGVHYIAMELVEGENLAERIAAGGAPDLDDALGIARQIAMALEAAHRAGVVHRDLKPANVQLTADGTVKVLDFGLAKALEPDGSAATVSPDVTGSPTMLAATRAGVILGTAAYMSPEQARGGPVDKRTDIWSFGALLFELLTGKRPFSGATASDAMASILKEEPDWDLLPVATPRPVRRLLRRCLSKRADKRLHDIADARIEIDDVLDGAVELQGEPLPATGALLWRTALPWVIAAAMALWVLAPGGSPPPEPLRAAPTRFAIPVPEGSELVVALSPDGSRLVYRGRGEDGVQRLYLREMTSVEAAPIPQTEGAQAPFFSPDGEWIGFFDEGGLVKVSVADGVRFPIGGLRMSSGGASWGPNGTIAGQRDFGTGLFLVPDEGGAPTQITRVDTARAERQHQFPDILPGGRAVAFTILSGISSERHDVAVVSLDSGETTVLTRGRHPRYLPSGHLAFIRDDVLLAAPFDLDTLALTGEPVVMVGSVACVADQPSCHRGVYAVSDNGTLVYATATTRSHRDGELVWVDREGNQELITDERAVYSVPRLSPDGTRLLVSKLDGDRYGVWAYSFERGTLTRITSPTASSGYGAWSPDGTSLAFSSDREGPVNLFRQRVLGGAEAERVTSPGETTLAGSWSPDGRSLLATVIDPETLGDIVAVDPGSPDGLRTLIDSPADEYSPQFSPDGRWIAYYSTDGDNGSIYVQSYPDLGIRELAGSTDNVSDGQPLWSRDGRELFFWQGAQLMVVPVELGESVTIGRARPLLEFRQRGDLEGIRGYDIAPDGSRFVMVRPVHDAAMSSDPIEIQVVLNWSVELERLVPRQ